MTLTRCPGPGARPRRGKRHLTGIRQSRLPVGYRHLFAGMYMSVEAFCVEFRGDGVGEIRGGARMWQRLTAGVIDDVDIGQWPIG